VLSGAIIIRLAYEPLPVPGTRLSFGSGGDFFDKTEGFGEFIDVNLVSSVRQLSGTQFAVHNSCPQTSIARAFPVFCDQCRGGG
jgi:hypothetical protein